MAMLASQTNPVRVKSFPYVKNYFFFCSNKFDDTDYWVYLSSDHLFQVYYKVRQVLLQSATAIFITKCDGLLLQSATAFLLQSATSVITKCDGYYKV